MTNESFVINQANLPNADEVPQVVANYQDLVGTTHLVGGPAIKAILVSSERNLMISKVR